MIAVQSVPAKRYHQYEHQMRDNLLAPSQRKGARFLISSAPAGGLYDDFSPRLLGVDTASGGCEPTGAPLLPPPPVASGETEERFCTAGPNLDGPATGGRIKGLPSTAGMTFPQLIQQLEAATGQASLLLNDRLRSTQQRCRQITLSRQQEDELCEIADGISAAAYHVQKWAYSLQSVIVLTTPIPTQPPSSRNRSKAAHYAVLSQPLTPVSDASSHDDQCTSRRPPKPNKCEQAEEAFATVHYALPRLMVSASEAQKGLQALIKAHGDGAELHVRKLGIPVQDLRALVPHLERLISRLGRFSSSLRPDRQFRDFLHEHFSPCIGPKAARLTAMYVLGDERLWFA